MLYNYMHNHERKKNWYLQFDYEISYRFYTPGLGIVYLVATSLVFVTDA